MRFRLLEFLIVFAVCGFASVALVRASELFESLFYSFTLIVILISALCSVACTKSSRAFWMGFLIASASYLALMHLPPGDGPRSYGPELTMRTLNFAYDKLHPPPPDAPPFGGGGILSVPPENPFTRPGTSRDDSDPFGHEEEATHSDQGVDEESSDQPEDPIDALLRASDLTDLDSMRVPFSGGQRVMNTYFFRIGHSVWALLLGWMSGHFTSFVYRRSRRDQGPPRHASS